MQSTNYFKIKQNFNDLLNKIEFILWSPIFIWCGIFAFFNYNNFLCKNLWYTIFFVPFFFMTFFRKIIFCIFLGYVCAFFKDSLIEKHFDSKNINMDFCTILGTVENFEYIEHGVKLIVDDQKLGRLNLRCLIKNIHEDEISPGDLIKCKAKLYEFEDDNLSRNFSNMRKFGKIAKFGAVLTKPDVLIKNNNKYIYEIEKLRKFINAKIEKSFSKDVAPIVAALTTGDKGGISKKISQNYADAGISHILAISGLHISLVAGIIFFIMRWILVLIPAIALRVDIKKVSIVIALIFAALYTLIAGMRIPALRSLLMFFLVTIAMLFDRRPFSLRNVALVCDFILFFFPESIFSPGFYMSFFAVAALISYYEDHKDKNYFFGVIKSSFIASTSIIPFSMIFFNSIVLAGVIFNIFAIPLVGFIIVPSIILFMLFGDFFAPFVSFGVKFLNLIAGTSSHFDYFKISLATPSDFVIFVMIFGVLVLIINKNRIFGFGSIFFALICYHFEAKPICFVNFSKNLFAFVDDKVLYVNTLQKNRRMTNFWRQYSGCKIKKKMQNINQNIFISQNHVIEKFDDCIKIDNNLILHEKDIKNQLILIRSRNNQIEKEKILINKY